jgi:hypothetical protein
MRGQNEARTPIVYSCSPRAANAASRGLFLLRRVHDELSELYLLGLLQFVPK